jgi:hypothetical protein
LAEKHRELNQEQQRRSDHAKRVSQLQRAVDVATEALALADSRHQFFRSRIVELREIVKDLWGQSRTDLASSPQVDPAASLLDAYQSIDTLLSAASDFSRCRELLVKNANAAKLVLDNFTRDQS